MDSRHRWVLEKLKEKYCSFWPDCHCNTGLLDYLDKFDREEDFTIEQLAAIETVIFMSLRCIEDCCPDPKGRRWATIELMDPWWNRQRQGMELTDNG